MKRIALLLALVCAPLSSLRAQVTAEVALDQEHFLGGEKLVVPVRITNRSGQTLHLGGEPNWLTFSIESREGFIVTKTGDAPVTGKFDLESGEVATRRVEITPYFTLDRIGRYQVVATVRLAQWGTQITTKPASFDIINGAKLWAQNFGVPLANTNATSPPEVRRYTLEEANYLRTQLRLYLRLTDGEGGRIFKVFPIGPMVSFSQPDHQIDKECKLHVFYQNGARSFNYTVVNPDGDIVLRQTYDISGTRPRLKLDEAGDVVVVGGARRVSASDIPEPKKPAEANVAPPQS